MNLSDSLAKYRTDKPYIPNVITTPPPKNKYNTKLNNPVKIPVGIAERLLTNKKEFKALCIYFRLKALYYSGVIKHWKKYTSELCEHLEVSRNNFKSKINYLVQNDFAEFDGEHLRLCSLRKVAMRYGTKAKRKHLINSTREIELQVRAIAVNENLKQQQHVATNKLIKQVFYEQQQQLILKGKFESLPDIAQWNINNLRLSQRHKKLLKKEILKAYEKNPELFNNKYMQRVIFTGDKNLPQMRTTISCMRLAELLNCKPNASTGHYWEWKMYEHYYLDIKGEVLRINEDSRINKIAELKAMRDYFKLDEQSEQVVTGTYIRTNKRNKKRYAFKRLSNTLTTGNALFCS